LGKDVVNRRINLLRAEGVEFITDTDIGQDISTSELKAQYDAIIFTTGATKARDLPAENRDAKGIYPAMDYLTANTKSLLDNGHVDIDEFSATGKDVIVIGGGDTGTDCIGTAVRQGAKSLVNFELMSQPPVDRSENNPWPQWPNIFRVDYGHEEATSVFGQDPRHYQLLTKAFIKDENGNVSGLKTISVEFENGRLNEIAGTEKTWDTQLVLLSMGFVSPEHYLSEDAKIDLDERGNYKAEHGEYNTSKSGIFTAGDCRRGQSLVVWAINEGRGVAKSVNRYLSE